MTNFNQWLVSPIAAIDQQAAQAALTRQSQLTKPAGSLGQLERLAIQLAALQSSSSPQAERVHISVYAADHGVMAEGVSAFPQSVTAAMVRNFASGGAAISVLARQLEARLDVINVGTVEAQEPITGVSDQRIAAGTANFCHRAAMTEAQCRQALLIGKANVDNAIDNRIHLYIAGDMGIGNTTAASALASALMQCDATQLVGPGTGLDEKGIQHKLSIIRQALDKHRQYIEQPIAALQYLGGFEIAAMTGSYLACAKAGIPVLIDGFISSVAALAADKIQPGCRNWFIFSHQSAEPGHQFILDALDAKPLLNMQMRLGEASGAATVVPLLRHACALHNEMATFSQAQIDEALNR